MPEDPPHRLCSWFVVGAALCLPLAVGAHAVRAEPSSPMQAARLMRVTCPPDVFPLNPEALEGLMETPLIEGAAWTEVFGDAARRVPHAWSIEFTELSDDVAMVLLSVDLSDQDDEGAARAEEYASAICQHLTRQIHSLARAGASATEARQRVLAQERERAEASILERKEQLQHLRAESTAPELILEVVSTLERRRFEAQMELIAADARADALERALDRIDRQLEARAQNDPILAELEAIVELREKAVERSRHLSDEGRTALAEVDAANAELAEAKVQLYEHRDHLHRAAGGELMEQLQRELIELEVERAVHQALLENIEPQLEEARRHAQERRERAERIEELERAIESERARQAHIDEALFELRMERDSRPTPEVVVVGQ